MKVINLTPHIVRVCSQDGQTVIAEYPSSGSVRLTTTEDQMGEIGGVPVVRTVYGEAIGLPEPGPDTVYIVATLVAQALPHRTDLVSPNSGKTAVRDESGQIWAVRSFQKIA